MRINQNIAAMNTYTKLTAANTAKSKSLEKLSSGLRINRAGDDAAGLAISEKMRGQISGLNQAAKNAQDGISLIQTAEGALSETHSILQRMRELSVQSANDTNTATDRGEINKEISQLTTEINRIAGTTEFNKQNLLSGGLGSSVTQTTAATTVLGVDGVAKVSSSGAAADTYTISFDAGKPGKLTMTNVATSKSQTIDNVDGAQKLDFTDFGVSIETNAAYVKDTAVGNVEVTGTGLKFQIGANKNQSMDLNIANMNSVGLGIGGINVTTQAGANSAIEAIDGAIDKVSAERSMLGANQNRLDHTINNLTTTSENLTAAESRIRDVDMAQEMMQFTKNNILSSAATSMLAQANQMPQSVLQLLQ